MRHYLEPMWRDNDKIRGDPNRKYISADTAMRAEMTVGLDLKSLENLRIVNGYGDVKKERKLSFEAPSSPEESDSGQQDVTSGKAKTKSKCGRPANPIPRHKRDSHIKAEYKRRDKIQKGFDTLLSMVPELSEAVTGKESRSAMLFKTGEYCRRLKSECGSSQTEITALRQELEALGSEIHELQDRLPQHGVKPCDKKEVSMDTLYDQYIVTETKKNWKFWIFGFFMRPLYDSYKHSMADKDKSDEFNSTLFEWVQTTLSLKSLRKGFLDSLRYISKHTGIMTHPDKLEEEARTRVHEHFLCSYHHSQAPLAPKSPISPASTAPSTCRVPTPVNLSRVTTPASTPRVTTPVPASPHCHTPLTGTSRTCTPLPTPTTSPPRTPNVSKRSTKRESFRSLESRSRSNSPDIMETKVKRRSSYRSRSGKRSPSAATSESDKKLGYSTSPTQSTQISLSHYLANQHSPSLPKQQQQRSIKSEASTTHQTHQNSTIHQNSTKHPSMHNTQRPMTNQPTTPTQAVTQGNCMTDLSDDLITSFVATLINAMKPHSSLPEPAPVSTPNSIPAPTSSPIVTSKPVAMTTTTENTFMPSSSSLFSTPSSMITLDSHCQDISTTMSTTNGFVPLDKSSVVTDGQVMQVDDDLANSHNLDPIISDFLSMDTFTNEYTSSDSLMDIPTFSHGDSLSFQTASNAFQSLTGDQSMCVTSAATGNNSDLKTDMSFINSDEDSLMNMLKVDVMDVNTVMGFLKKSDQQS